MVVDEFNAARRNLGDAMDRYLNACLAAETLTMSDGAWFLLRDHLASLRILDTKIRKAWKTIGRTMNSCSTPTSLVGALPTEVLTRILLLVPVPYRRDPRTMPKSEGGLPLTFQLERLMLVCSRWHQMALSMKEFWTHIDLAWDDHQLGRHLVVRARVSAARAGHLPLNILVKGPTSDSSSNNPNYTPVALQFLAHYAPRIGSLELVSNSSQRLFYQSVIPCVLKHCKPEVFSELVFSSDLKPGTVGRSYYGMTIESNESLQDRRDILVDIPQQRLDEVLISIKSLRLCDLYPRWTSKIYEGLVELYFGVATWPTTPLTEQELLGILHSCPRLQSLSLIITCLTPAPLPENVSIAPVRLGDLKLLRIWMLGFDHVGRVLRLIAPGTKPLFLSLGTLRPSGPFVSMPADPNILKEFSARSNITSVYMSGSTTLPWIPQMLHVLPSHLDVLTLSEFDTRLNAPPIPNEPKRILSWIDFLDIFSSIIDFYQLLELKEHMVIKKLRFSGCTFVIHGRTVTLETAKRYLSIFGADLIIRESAEYVPP